MFLWIFSDYRVHNSQLLRGQTHQQNKTFHQFQAPHFMKHTNHVSTPSSQSTRARKARQAPKVRKTCHLADSCVFARVVETADQTTFW